jgi:hypothetical protein
MIINKPWHAHICHVTIFAGVRGFARTRLAVRLPFSQRLEDTLASSNPLIKHAYVQATYTNSSLTSAFRRVVPVDKSLSKRDPP